MRLRLLTVAKRAWLSDDARLLLSLSLFIVVSGSVFFHFQEGLRWLDALYFTVVTLTTVGYGDFSPQTDLGKIFTMAYILVGLGIFAATIGVLAELVLEVAREEGS